MVTSKVDNRALKQAFSMFEKLTFRKWIIQYVIVTLVFLAIGPAIFSSSWVSSSDFHACIEISSSLIAMIAGITGIIYFFSMRNTFFLIVGLGFFICGTEDLVHGFISFNRLWGDSGVDFSRFIPGTYVTGRLLLGLFTIMAVLFERIINDEDRQKQIARRMIPTALLFGAVSTFVAFYIPLPQFIYPDLLISRPVDFISAIVFIAAFFLVMKRMKATGDIFSHFLILCLLLNIGGQVYMSFSKQLFDIFFDVAHVANILSYVMPVIGLSAFMIQQQKELNIQKQQVDIQLNEIKKINTKLNDYSFTISHDLKEPIRSIRTFSQFIQDDYKDKLDEEGIDYLSRIISAAKRMATMIDDLLELSKVGRTDIEFRETDVGEILKEVESELKQKIEDTHTVITAGQLPVIRCQPVWITAVLRNLISNSIKYGNPEKTEISIKCSETGTHYEFYVTDNGQGIADDQHKKIFGIFRRATGNKDADGSGAGLAIVSAVIDEHKGSIAVEQSEPGKGTTIKFTISKNLSNIKKRRKYDE